MGLKKASLIKNSYGSTIIELTAAISILGVLAAYAAPHYVNVIKIAKDVVCLSERRVIERIEAVVLAENGYTGVLGIEELVKQNYINKMPQCPSGGKYFWLKQKPIPELGCTVHNQGEK